VELVLRIAGQVVGGRSRGSVEQRCGVFEVDADFIWIFDKKPAQTQRGSWAVEFFVRAVPETMGLWMYQPVKTG
jgi:hypothetical protein